MARIKLTESTGGAYINKAEKNALLQITSCEYDPEFGKISMILSNERGETMQNNFRFMNNDGSQNEPALKAFSYFSRVAMGDWTIDGVDDQDLIGKYIRADISLREGKEKSKDGEIIKFANLDKVYQTDDEFQTSKVSAAAASDEDYDDEVTEEDEDWD